MPDNRVPVSANSFYASTASNSTAAARFGREVASQLGKLLADSEAHVRLGRLTFRMRSQEAASPSDVARRADCRGCGEAAPMKTQQPAAAGAAKTTHTPAPRLRPMLSRWEREARMASGAFLRGDSGIARLLTPAAPAARRQRAQGSGESLPVFLRGRLERAFHADLSAVRLHRDVAAHEAAHAAGARAFTTGNEIFFARGAFSPANRDGFELLGHEVAHVLQQTGEADESGLVHAREQYGTAAAQALKRTLRPARRPISGSTCARNT